MKSSLPPIPHFVLQLGSCTPTPPPCLPLMDLYKRGSASSSHRAVVGPGRTEFEILKASHRCVVELVSLPGGIYNTPSRFLRPEDEDDGSLSWNEQVAKKYYSSLYREFAVCDLKHYKSGNVPIVPSRTALDSLTAITVLPPMAHRRRGYLRSWGNDLWKYALSPALSTEH